MARLAGVSPNALLRIERDEGPANDWILGRILRCLGARAKEAFPGAQDIFDFLVPPRDFAGWLRNFRLRRGLQQAELARILGIHKVSLHRYEKGVSRPDRRVLERLIREYGLEKDKFIRRYLIRCPGPEKSNHQAVQPKCSLR